MIDMRSEQLQLFAKAARSLPDSPHVGTLHRWSRQGVRGRRLESIVIGGRRYTSVEALQRFVAAVTAERDGASSQP